MYFAGCRRVPLSESAGVSEQVDFLGDRSQQFPQAIFFHFIEAKPLSKLADVPNFFLTGSVDLIWRAGILHSEILGVRYAFT
jgi:hypothetical protein